MEDGSEDFFKNSYSCSNWKGHFIIVQEIMANL